MKRNPYLTAEQTAALMTLDNRTKAQKELDALLEEGGANEMGSDSYRILYDIAVRLLALAPQRKALTDEQLRAALTGRSSGWITDTVRQIARDVEAAHGITQADQQEQANV